MTTPANMFRLVDQQEHFLVVDKSAEQSFHDEGDLGSGFFHQVQQAFPRMTLFPVHRLDKMTSGLILFAASRESAQAFQKLFEQHQVEKYYLAVSDQKPKKKQGLIKGDMARSRRSAWKLLRSLENPAITQFFSYNVGVGTRLFLLKPWTGKTHQIRVAMSSIGSPVLGDPIYYPGSISDRGYLHAYALRFQLFGTPYSYCHGPEQGKLFLSETVQHQLREIEKPWNLPWPSL